MPTQGHKKGDLMNTEPGAGALSVNYHVRFEQGRAPIKIWTRGVHVEEDAIEQLENVAALPFIHKHVAAMPDVHWGMGATIASVIPTSGAVIPAAVGVDIGCGMAAVRLDGAHANHLPDSLSQIRSEVEHTVPVGFGQHQGLNTQLDKARTKVKSFLKFLERCHRTSSARIARLSPVSAWPRSTNAISIDHFNIVLRTGFELGQESLD